MRKLDLKYFDWLYIFLGVVFIAFTYLNLEFPNDYKGDFTPTSSFSWTDFGVVAVVSVILLVVAFLDYRSIKSMSNKVYFPAVVFVLGIILIPLFTYYGAFNGLLESGQYNLSGVSLGGLLLVFASLGEIYLMRK